MTAIPPFRPVSTGPLLRPLRSAPARPAAAKTPEPAKAPPAAVAAEPAAIPSFDPQAVLTPEERDFFAANAVLGPLTYRPRAAAADAIAPPTGQRIDVRG
jgi:hypothetical protein